MSPSKRATPSPILGRWVLAAALLACVGLSGCEEVASIDVIRQQQKAGDFEGSLDPLRELLAEQPDDGEANFLYGRALAYTQPDLAVWSLRKAMEDPDWSVPAGLQLAFVGLAAGDFNEVVKITGRILERDPENVRALMMRANAYAHSKQDPELALADAKRILELDPDASEAYEPLILALLALDRLEEAGAALADAGRLLVELEVGGRLLAWHCATTAVFQQESDDLEGARETWLACLDAHPTDLDVVTSAIGFYDRQGEPDRSLEVLRAAFAGAPDFMPFRAMLARRLVNSGDPAAAEALLRDATGSEKPHLAAAAWLELARLRQSLGEYEAAADALARLVELERAAGSPSPQLLFEYADALVLAERFGLAVEVAEGLSVPAHRHLILGRVAQERHEPAEALAEFDEALRLWPDNAWAHYAAALAAEELGDFERALGEYRSAVRVEPGTTDARTRAAALLLADGKAGPALLLLQASSGEAPLEIAGLLLGMRLSGLLGDTIGVADFLALIEAQRPVRAGQALAEAAEGLALRGGPALAESMLLTAPGVDYGEPRYAAALRALVRFSHEADETGEMRTRLEGILAAQPVSSVHQAIRGLDLELSGAPAEAVRAAYARALELGPGNAWALAGLGRLALGDDPEAALGFFDRAAAADPSDPDPRLGAARALVASGQPERAAERLDGLLLEHPFLAEAAAERARLDLERDIATPQTLERARRAVRFGGGADSLELLSRVYAQRGEPELAERAAEGAEALREAAASEG